ncbi:unnamed protein product [Pleuronectes platessa]|uniref:Uncharacterized protein n=1 Tax=Pleuronectes platessa TaxID=8262 RepID=A0A9N7VBP7_PLEPL|nr:unnamed protein product [Pleuronectes platessa]
MRVRRSKKVSERSRAVAGIVAGAAVGLSTLEIKWGSKGQWTSELEGGGRLSARLLFPAHITVVAHRTATQQGGKGREGKVRGEEGEERIGERGVTVGGSERHGGGSAGTSCGVSAPCCHNMTLTGLCNQTGLAQSRRRAALTVI